MSNNSKPTGPIRATAGEDAQGFRQHLASLLTSIIEAKSQINRERLTRGQPPMPVGLPISEHDAALLMATQAICSHLHHLTSQIVELRLAISGLPPSAAEQKAIMEGLTRLRDMTERDLAEAALERQRRTPESDLEEDR